jgi:hypothetical protein
LPHLVLNILISGNDDDALAIRTEMITVLNDQVDMESNSTSDKKLLTAQVCNYYFFIVILFWMLSFMIGCIYAP